MPPEENNGIDLRPVGATAGAALPTVGLLKYLLHELPKYHRKLKDAPDWTLANGDIDVARAMKELKPGDFGLSGLQDTTPDVNFLVHGSAAASGGPGAHGQIVGNNLQTPYRMARMPESARTPDFPFLMNDRGELYSPAYARNYNKLHDIRARMREWGEYQDATAAGKTVPKPAVPKVTKADERFYKQFMTGYDTSPSSHDVAMSYGNKKETLRGRSRELQQLKQQSKAWQAFDAGKTTVKPDVPKPSAKQMQQLSTANKGTASRMREFLKSPSMQGFFGGSPQAKADATLSRVQQLAEQMSGVSGENAAAQRQKMYDLAAKMESRPGGKALADSVRRTAEESLGRALTPGAKPLQRSPIFKPKLHERFIPTLHHGGMMGSADDPILHFISQLPGAVLDEIKARSGIGVRTLARRLAANTKELDADRAYTAKNPWSIYRRTFGRPNAKKVISDGLGATDTIFGASAPDGSRMRPAEIPGVAAYGSGGPRGTMWARFVNGVDPDKLHQGLVNQVGQSYDSTGAVGAGNKQVFGLNGIRQWLHKVPGFRPAPGNCWGNHCGSMPAKVFEYTKNIQPKITSTDVLPSTLLLDDNVQLLGVQNKGRVISDLFRKTMPRRVAAGIGAAGLLGSVGYGAGAIGNAFKTSPVPAKPKLPQLDPAMFSKAMKLLQPR